MTNSLPNNWIYANSRDNSARFILGEKGSNPLVCFGVNPSTAEPNNLDNTLRRVRNESIARNFNGWIMLNLYPQRATDPQYLHKEIDLRLHQSNLEHIKAIFSMHSNLTVWAAWGGLIKQRSYLIQCLHDIVAVISHSSRWVHIGKLVSGTHPHHPLYLKKCLPFNSFKTIDYLGVDGSHKQIDFKK